MGFLDDLTKATTLFNQGVQDLATTNAFNRASEQVQEIKNQQLDQLESRQAAEQVSQQLAQDLAASGAPASQIQAGFASFSPAPLPGGAELISEGVQLEAPERVQQGLDIITLQKFPEAQARREIELSKQQRALQKEQRDITRDLSKEGRRRFGTVLDKFQTDTKTEREGLTKIDSALNILGDPTADPVAVATGVRTLLTLSGEKRFSEQDFKTALPGGRSAVQSFLRRFTEEGLDPRALARDKRILSKIIKMLGASTLKSLKEAARNKAKANKDLIPGKSEEELTKSLLLSVPSSEFLSGQGRGAQQQRQPVDINTIPGFSD